MSPPRNCYSSCIAVLLSRFLSVRVLVACFQRLLKIPTFGLSKCAYSCSHCKISCFQLATSFSPLFTLSIPIYVCSFNSGQWSRDYLLAMSQCLFFFFSVIRISKSITGIVFPPPTQTSSYFPTVVTLKCQCLLGTYQPRPLR